MARKTDHVLLSLGVRKDQPPHEHLWCTMCGEWTSLRLPDDIDMVLKRMTKFRRVHADCSNLKMADQMLMLGYKKFNGAYIWGGALSIYQIASAVYNATGIELDNIRHREFKRIHEGDVEAAIRWLIENPKATREQFYEAKGKMFQFAQPRPDNCWEEIRVCIFFDTARALINIGRGKK
jgi:hypothetical protein